MAVITRPVPVCHNQSELSTAVHPPMTAHLVTVHEGVGVVAVVGVPAPVQHQHPQGARHEHNDEQPTNMNIYTSILTSNYELY